MEAPSSGRAGALRRVRTFAQVFRYLVDVLDWPLEADDFQDEDLTAFTYDWDPDEMGIPADKLRRVWQMRPLTAAQPWGVFFLEFAGSRLPITQVRHVLRVLVTSKRAAASGLPTWRLDDLLFVVLTGDADSVELNLLAFRGSDPRSAEFLPLAWRPEQSPSRHLARLAEELLPLLRWPDDDSAIESWRAAWRKPFELPIGRPIRDAARLAERMAKTARDLREQLTEALESEEDSGPFSTLMQEIRARLVSDIDGPRFADMCAQTLVYGLLSSRANNREGFGSSPIFSTVPLANPFLEAFFEQIHDQAALLDLPGSGLPQLVADLQETNVEGILDQFGSTIRGGDPVIHFYEEFLKLYDRKLRADAGAFYTPQPVVECMVRLVDEVLRSRFGLTMGIADSSSWEEVAERNDFTVPDGIDPDKPFVSMIDPATGTGTFLIEWIRCARKSFIESRPEEDWPQHLRDQVLPSMHAFESMLASYTIAHLKVALELYDTDVNESNILLTDTLDHAPREIRFEIMNDPVAKEGERAAYLKERERFTVVIGNPPYDRQQRSANDTSRRKGGVVRYGVPGIDPLIKTITEPMRDAGLGVHLKNIYNDYVYFWRWAVWQATELPPGPGVVCFITASSYLEGKSMGGVRDMLRRAFDELWIVDLGGEGRAARTEENIFDIRTPVAIAIGLRAVGDNECIIRYLRIAGSRIVKLAKLRGVEFSDDEFDEEGRFQEVSGTSLERFTPRGERQYYDWPEITDLFPWVHTGCELKRTWPIGETKHLLNKRWQALIKEVPRNRGILLRETGDRTLKTAPRPLLRTGQKLIPILDLNYESIPEGIRQYGYRSFDRQYIIADNRLISRSRPGLWCSYGKHQIFLATLTLYELGQGPVMNVSPYLPDRHYFCGRGGKDCIPLYYDPEGRLPNIADNLLTILHEQYNDHVSPEDILSYVYALGGTSAFSERFSAELAEAAGPVHIPITADLGLFKKAVELGSDLLWWHTWGERFAPAGVDRLPTGRTQQINPVEGMPDNYNYDSKANELSVGTGLFVPVNPEVWNFEVSGLKVLKSWLNYRMRIRSGRKSSPLDDIRPDRWTQTDELLRLLAILEHTVEVTPTAAELLEEIVSGPLILAKDLPQPTDAQRKPPSGVPLK